MKRFLWILVAVPSAWAQFIGYGLPQNVTATVMNAVTVNTTTPNTGACPVAAGSACSVPQIGQSVHSVQYTTAGPVTSVLVKINGSYDGVTFYTISDEATLAPTGTVVAYGYYPFVSVSATFTGATSITVNYTGSVVSYIPYGNQQTTLTWKVLANSIDATVNQSLHATTPAPFGGLLAVKFGTASCSTSTLVATGGTFAGGTYTLLPSTTLVNSTNAQYYFIPPMASTGVTFAYTAGGCGGGALLSMSFAIYDAIQMVGGSDYGQPPVISPLAVSSTGGISIAATSGAPVKANTFTAQTGNGSTTWFNVTTVGPAQHGAELLVAIPGTKTILTCTYNVEWSLDGVNSGGSMSGNQDCSAAAAAVVGFHMTGRTIGYVRGTITNFTVSGGTGTPSVQFLYQGIQ